MVSGVTDPGEAPPGGEAYAGWLVNFIGWVEQGQTETGGMLDWDLAQQAAAFELSTFLMKDPEMLDELLWQEVAQGASMTGAVIASGTAEFMASGTGAVIGKIKAARSRNAYGSRGGPPHTHVVKEIENDIRAKGFEPATEYKVDLLGPGTESKSFRRVDVAALDANGNPVEFHQVGDMTRGGRPTARERRAIIDITEFSDYTDVPLHFWPKRYQ
jgi:hypothetical protein